MAGANNVAGLFAQGQEASSANSFCPYCGKPISVAGAKFCPSCGKQLG